MSDALGDAAAQLAELSAALGDAEARARRAEAANDRMRAELEELQAWSDELERRLAATTSELDAARTRRGQDERDIAYLRHRLAAAEAVDDRSAARPSPRSPAAEAEIQAISRRAEAEAEALAVDELARAVRQARPDR